jgi:peroxiredoxin
VGKTSGGEVSVHVADTALRAEDVKPLQSGNRAPETSLRRPAGRSVDMADLYQVGPSVLIFYRGGWCPYCNVHLGQIAKAESELKQMGYQVLAISPDRPEELQKSVDKQHLSYQLLSDSDMALCRAFGLAFRVDDATIKQYHGYGIDLEKSSGQSHHLLPVPAVYIVDTEGVIRFAHWTPDYKTRLQPETLLNAARQALPN